jgi:predicted Abi (CAAX) family protease
VNAVTRIRGALTTIPTAHHWRRTLLELLWLAPVLAALGWAGGLVDTRTPVDLEALARFAVIGFFIPCLTEELFFRAAIVPRRASRLHCLLAIAAFVLWHPLQALWFGAAWAEVVLNPWFLAAVAALGVATTRLYLATLSIWPAVAVHWLVVVAWKALGGASPWS